MAALAFGLVGTAIGGAIGGGISILGASLTAGAIGGAIGMRSFASLRMTSYTLSSRTSKAIAFARNNSPFLSS